eukprot:scaffold49079_cov62-Phaeocystis_antarctica.AAC.1
MGNDPGTCCYPDHCVGSIEKKKVIWIATVGISSRRPTPHGLEAAAPLLRHVPSGAAPATAGAAPRGARRGFRGGVPGL